MLSLVKSGPTNYIYIKGRVIFLVKGYVFINIINTRRSVNISHYTFLYTKTRESHRKGTIWIRIAVTMSVGDIRGPIHPTPMSMQLCLK